MSVVDPLPCLCRCLLTYWKTWVSFHPVQQVTELLTCIFLLVRECACERFLLHVFIFACSVIVFLCGISSSEEEMTQLSDFCEYCSPGLYTKSLCLSWRWRFPKARRWLQDDGRNFKLFYPIMKLDSFWT